LQFIENLIPKSKKHIEGIKENIKLGTLTELINEQECYLKHLT